ncbi:MAG: sialidase family protein, partial [Ilumatobacteraceae bacterium]
MREGYGDETPTMGGVRMTSTTIALLTPLALLAACGDGIDERYDRAEAAPDAPLQTTTTVPPEPPTALKVTPLVTTLTDSRADFSGVRNILQLADGTWLLSGFDNHSDPSQPEPGAVWHSDDLTEWQRVGDGISDDSNQQVIDTLVEVGDTVLAAGSDFARYGDDDSGHVADAAVWRSDDQGRTFDRQLLATDAAVNGAAVIDDIVLVWGYEFDDDLVAHGQIWRSDDAGETWTDLSPAASPGQGAAAQPLGPIEDLIVWDDSLVAVGIRTDTDPEGSDYPLDDIALGSATEAWEPVDIGIWYSDDIAATWRTATPTGLTGVDGAQ